MCKQRSASNPFTFGCLKFDDYNYNYINSVLLISREKVKAMRNETLELKNTQNGFELNEETLGKSAEKWGECGFEDFQEFQNDINKEESSYTLKQQSKDEDEIDSKNNSQKLDDNKEAKDLSDDEEEEEEESEEEDNFSTKGFDRDEIKLIRRNQESDPFYDIIQLKNETVFKDSRLQIFQNANNILGQAEADEDSVSYSKRELIKSNYLHDFEDSNSSKVLNIEESQAHSSSNSLIKRAGPSSSKFGVSTMVDDANKNGKQERPPHTYQGSTEKYDLSNK